MLLTYNYFFKVHVNVYFKQGVSLHYPLKVRFREYFVYFLMRQEFKKINHSEGTEKIDFTY